MADLSIAALAFVGDAVYELYIRESVAECGSSRGGELHRQAVRFVRAESQAAAVKYLMREGMLSDEETALVKRARNHKTPNRSRSADPVEYRLATAFEALVGMHHMKGNTDRAREIMGEARDYIAKGTE
ncbi:MAG: Mini-ribonuclease 3 [Eubacterium sp.]|jgi:ribonuclease-3 family protein